MLRGCFSRSTSSPGDSRMALSGENMHPRLMCPLCLAAPLRSTALSSAVSSLLRMLRLLSSRPLGGADFAPVRVRVSPYVPHSAHTIHLWDVVASTGLPGPSVQPSDRSISSHCPTPVVALTRDPSPRQVRSDSTPRDFAVRSGARPWASAESSSLARWTNRSPPATSHPPSREMQLPSATGRNTFYLVMDFHLAD